MRGGGLNNFLPLKKGWLLERGAYGKNEKDQLGSACPF